MKCNLHFAGYEGNGIQVELPSVEGYVIGRSDEALHYTPDIDLSGYNSLDKGVSRRHAAFVNYRGIPHVIDLFSANGTYLNGRRLPPEQPYPLGDYNELRLGTLDIIITIS